MAVEQSRSKAVASVGQPQRAEPTLGSPPARRDQFLTFRLAGQDYGIEILHVQEIRAWEQPTRLPHAPAYVQGVINLRGAVVPILDLKSRFGVVADEQRGSPVVIVVTTPAPQGVVTTGIVVDAVCEVCEISSDMLQPPPEVGSGIDSDLVRGLSTVGETLLILLDAERLVSRVAQRPPQLPERSEGQTVASTG